MKPTTINYFISENYIPDWTVEDALRELYQNFIDYGEYSVDKISVDKDYENVIFSNDFTPETANLLIIGDSNKTENSRGKYGEGLKMAALVLLRNGGNCIINTVNFSAVFKLIVNESTDVKTLGVTISASLPNIRVHNFDVSVKLPIGIFDNYQDKLIVPTDVLHTNESYGSIVSKPKGNLYVGGLFVCNLKDINYAYDLLPKHISLDRDRKVPQNFEVKWTISKIQETYVNFDITGKSNDVEYSNIPHSHLHHYKPKLQGNDIIFTTKIIDSKGEEKEVVVSNNFRDQLKNESFFYKFIFKLKGIIANSLNIDQLALKYRKEYCKSKEAREDFDALMLRLGIDIEKLLSKEEV